ncbi:hypothetical protein RvY_10565-2 [Ramazzottius varieornatus]|uniref:Uncharacterized protein n=1 Tax=Ramazzottius varieornatus TaxID=947166 RepID=A0A1D1VD61_RAMVA|nr:hypothetical protein RvY_10565-2 [Ramazzottius varieornatus]
MKGTAPVSTMVCASSGECLDISDMAPTAALFKDTSGSRRHMTSKGPAPESTTPWASSVLWRATEVRASAACSRSAISGVSKQVTYSRTFSMLLLRNHTEGS